MKEDEDFCPILKRVRSDTMQLVKHMAETEGRGNGGRRDSTRTSETGSPDMEAAHHREKADIPASLKPRGYLSQTLEDMFDLTKGRFPCDRK